MGQGRSDVKETQIDVQLVDNEWDKSRTSKIRFSYNKDNFYQFYEYTKRQRNEKPIDKARYMKFLVTYFKLVMARVVQEGFIWILPFNMGRFYLHKTNRMGFIKEYKNVRNTLNLHSFRKFYAVKWDKETAHFKNRNIWRHDTNNWVNQLIKAEIDNYNKPIIERPLIGHNHNEKKW